MFTLFETKATAQLPAGLQSPMVSADGVFLQSVYVLLLLSSLDSTSFYFFIIYSHFFIIFN